MIKADEPKPMFTLKMENKEKTKIVNKNKERVWATCPYCSKELRRGINDSKLKKHIEKCYKQK